MNKLIRSFAIAAAVLFSQAAAHAQCQPSSPSVVRVGIAYNADGSAAGAWAYWWCVMGTTVTYEWRAAPSSALTSTVMTKLRDYALGKNPSFAKTALTLAADDPALAPMRAAVAAAAAKDAGKPQPAAAQ